MASTAASRLGLAWIRVRDSLWFIPGLSVVAGSALAIVAVRIPSPTFDGTTAGFWIFGGGSEGARGVLSAIAGGLITVTGTIFSVTIIALQLASSQFTPRLLRSFVADRVNQSVLGIFIGTFTYTLLVLRTVRSEADDRVSFVPHVGVTLALALLLVSIGGLIVFINHAAQSIRASVILHRESRRILEVVDDLFPSHIGRPSAHGGAQPPIPSDGHAWPADAPALVGAERSGYLQSVHANALWELGKSDAAPRSGVISIRMELHIGEFAFPGKPIAAIWPAGALDDRVERAVRDAFVLGPDRTPEQDLEYGLVELSDIAVKALSPGINDPTTAAQAIDRLVEVLAALASRVPPDSVRSSPDGGVRLLARHTQFDRAAGLAFDQIRHFGADNPGIVTVLLERMLDLASVVPAHLLPVVGEQVDAITRAARRAIVDSGDLRRLEPLAARALQATITPPPAAPPSAAPSILAAPAPPPPAGRRRP